jgi:hypothetical protein
MEKENVIRFSHSYHKLPTNWEMETAVLKHVEPIRLEDQNYDFLEFDTRYHNSLPDSMVFDDYDSDKPKCHYKLPKKGKYLILYFKSEDGMAFQTIRSASDRFGHDKETYYKNLVGKTFKLERTVEK